MKRFNSLIVLALFVVVGGVYATWNYATGTVTQQTQAATITITDKVVQADQAKGTIAIQNNALSIVIDDTDDNHIAELIITGNLDVTFTPSATAEKDTLDLGFVVTCDSAIPTYKENPIFSLKKEPIKLTAVGASSTNNINKTNLAQAITLASIELPTIADYDQFRQDLGTVNLTITVTEFAA